MSGGEATAAVVVIFLDADVVTTTLLPVVLDAVLVGAFFLATTGVVVPGIAGGSRLEGNRLLWLLASQPIGLLRSS